MRKRIWLVVVAGLVLASVIAALVLSRTAVVSTHHAAIRIAVPEYESDKDRQLRDYERVVQAVEAWAGPAGLYRLPDDTNLPRQRWFGSGTERNERIVWFQTRHDKFSRIREVMIACDPDGPDEIQLLLADYGYSQHPNRQLRAMYEALLQRMEELFSGKVHGRIW